MEDSVFSGQWCRFSRYEIRGGYIVPAPDAAWSTYHPMIDFQTQRTDDNQQTAYQEFFKLSRRIGYSASSPGAEEAILKWCNTYGLLGLLLHQVQLVRFAPRWEERWIRSPDLLRTEAERKSTCNAPAGGQLPRLAWTQWSLQRSPHGYFRKAAEQNPLLTHPMRVREGTVVDKSYWPNREHDVFIHDPITGNWQSEPIDRTWCRFFPGLPPRERARHIYPAPSEPQFWSIYGEHVQDFVDAAKKFEDAYMRVLAIKNPKAVDPNDMQGPAGTFRLNSLLEPTAPVLAQTGAGAPTTFEVTFPFCSLFHCLVLMAQQDLASDRRVVRCNNEKCKVILLATGYQTSYCSKQCRDAAAQRRLRARRRKS